MAIKDRLAELSAEMQALREELARERAQRAQPAPCFHYHFAPQPVQVAPSWWQPQPWQPVWVTTSTTLAPVTTSGGGAGDTGNDVAGWHVTAVN